MGRKRTRVLVNRDELKRAAEDPDADPQLPALYVAVSARPTDINLVNEELIHLSLRANAVGRMNFLNDYLVRVATAAHIERLPRPEELPDPEKIADLKGLSKRMKEYLVCASAVAKLEKQIAESGKDLLTIRRARGIPIGAQSDAKQVDAEALPAPTNGSMFRFKRSSPPAETA